MPFDGATLAYTASALGQKKSILTIYIYHYRTREWGRQQSLLYAGRGRYYILCWDYYENTTVGENENKFQLPQATRGSEPNRYNASYLAKIVV